jgi:hypothetical protein
MPPSGYSTEQSKELRQMLHSCANALESEAKEARVPYTAGLKNELENIAQHLSTHPLTAAQSAILRITEAFYSEVLKLHPVDQQSYWHAVERALANIESQMLAIKIAVPANH